MNVVGGERHDLGLDFGFGHGAEEIGSAASNIKSCSKVCSNYRNFLLVGFC